MSTEDSWVLDSLVCFLHGPVWNAPLQTFIEEKSLGKLIESQFKFFVWNQFLLTNLLWLQSSIPICISMRTVPILWRFIMSIKIWWITCWAVSWRKCKSRRNNLRLPAWKVEIRTIICTFTRDSFSRWVYKYKTSRDQYSEIFSVSKTFRFGQRMISKCLYAWWPNGM